jgi:papain like cysteine protease AvrRpt2
MSTLRERSRTPVRRPPHAPRPAAAQRRGPAGLLGGLSLWLRRFRDLLEQVPKPRWRRVALTMQDQLQSQWCWAACSASVSRFYDTASSWTQCRVVNAELEQTGCCQDGATGQCNQPWYLQRALTRTGNLVSWSSGTVPMATIRSQIDAGRPVGVRIGWAGGGGHFVMISGCLDAATGLLEVRDPIFGTSEISIASFASNYQGSGSWTHTYYTEA